MSAVDPTARVLSELIANKCIIRSAIGVRTRKALEPLFHAGALSEERSGAGWRVVVSNPDAVLRFARAIFPGGLTIAASGHDRSEAIALLRDAKRGTNRIGEPVLMRAFSEHPLVSHQDEVDVRDITRCCGTACFVLSDERLWRYGGNRVALVENLEPFLRFEQRFNGFDAAVYCAGRMSDRLLRWMGLQAFDVVHFGDYDPVGLQEYIRLMSRLESRASLYVPENLRELVQRYGKIKLMSDSIPVLAGLRSAKNASIQEVLHCLEEFGAGLEQEILWSNVGDI